MSEVLQNKPKCVLTPLMSVFWFHLGTHCCLKLWKDLWKSEEVTSFKANFEQTFWRMPAVCDREVTNISKCNRICLYSYLQSYRSHGDPSVFSSDPPFSLTLDKKAG